MLDEEEIEGGGVKGSDLIEIPDDDPIVFTDNPDGTPADLGGDGPEGGSDGDGDTDGGGEGTDGEDGAGDGEGTGEGEGDDTSGGDDEPGGGDLDDKPNQQRRRGGKKRSSAQERINEVVGRSKALEEQLAAERTRRELVEEELAERREQDRKLMANKEEELVRRKREALDDNDLSTYAEVQDELTDLRLRMKGHEPEPRAPKQQEAPAQHPAAAQWVSDNQWFAKPENRDIAEFAMHLEAKLQAKMGMSDEMYKELDRQLAMHSGYAAAVAGEGGAGAGDDGAGNGQDGQRQQQQRSKPRQVVASATGADVTDRSDNSKDKRGLTKYDRQIMAQYNLDANDPKVVATYLKRKSR